MNTLSSISSTKTEAMEKQQELELIKRISELVKQNKSLQEQVRKLTEENEKLFVQNEKNKSLLATLRTDGSAGKVEEAKALKFKMVTVLFAEILGFSEVSKCQNTKGVVDELDEILMHFDEIVKKYNIEKIKTIGDTYMCAGGIPIKNSTNPIDVIMAALEMQRFMENFQCKKEKVWNIRMGIHTGPVVASITGTKKVAYDIKGDTVNTASRIQSASQTGKVCISVMTYELVKEFFKCDFYGIMPVKYKDDMEIYIVNGIEADLSDKGENIIPNEKFRIKFLVRQLGDIQEIVLDRLEKELPPYLEYHNFKHTIDVVTQVELIGWGESVNDEDLLLLKTAGLFHDIGHIKGSKDHEEKGAEMVREILPKYHYTEAQINKICELIMATKIPPKPNNLLEKIICDSDLDYLGRSDFIPVSDALFRELKAQNLIGSFNDWNKMQIKFLSFHQFFTETARKLREVNKQMQIDRIQKLIVEE
ncbi:MAG: HD domain-containing protein [Bacteroidia bacterium]|nr:HD domain-containing protein [Bacteroidia bacterium]